jgi:hypothetical protein
VIVPRWVKSDITKKLESAYEDAEHTLRALSCRYRIGVIADQTAGTEQQLTTLVPVPFVPICLSSKGVGVKKKTQQFVGALFFGARLRRRYSARTRVSSLPGRHAYRPKSY